MFYAQFVHSKEGPLAKIWLAADWEKKLSKAQICEMDVQDAVFEIIQPEAKVSLRTSGHLLLGTVRIHSRKAKYVLADCNEAFLKLKMTFRLGGACEFALRDCGDRGGARYIPEVITDFDDDNLPEINDFDADTSEEDLHVGFSPDAYDLHYFGARWEPPVFEDIKLPNFGKDDPLAKARFRRLFEEMEEEEIEQQRRDSGPSDAQHSFDQNRDSGDVLERDVDHVPKDREGFDHEKEEERGSEDGKIFFDDRLTKGSTC